jgi:hypothetical protein
MVSLGDIWYNVYNVYKRHICCMQICKYDKKTLLEMGFMGLGLGGRPW